MQRARLPRLVTTMFLVATVATTAASPADTAPPKPEPAPKLATGAAGKNEGDEKAGRPAEVNGKGPANNNGNGPGANNGNGPGSDNDNGPGSNNTNGNSSGSAPPPIAGEPAPAGSPPIELLVTALGSGAALALSQEDAIVAVNAGRALPLAAIVALAEQDNSTKVINAELVIYRGMLIYKLITLSELGTSQQLFFSAATGAFLGGR